MEERTIIHDLPPKDFNLSYRVYSVDRIGRLLVWAAGSSGESEWWIQ